MGFSPRRQIAYIIAAVLATIPGVFVAVSHGSAGAVTQALFFGLAMVGAAFMLSWAAEVIQLDISAGLALALLALIAVLPEYAVDFVFTWKAGSDPSFAPLALANMTGANQRSSQPPSRYLRLPCWPIDRWTGEKPGWCWACSPPNSCRRGCCQKTQRSQAASSSASSTCCWQRGCSSRTANRWPVSSRMATSCHSPNWRRKRRSSYPLPRHGMRRASNERIPRSRATPIMAMMPIPTITMSI